MKVLMVAKTRQGGGACIGGITFEGRSVRLIAADAAVDEHVGLEYSVGDVWEVEAVAPHEVVPPHVENIVVQSKRRMGPMAAPSVSSSATCRRSLAGWSSYTKVWRRSVLAARCT